MRKRECFQREEHIRFLACILQFSAQTPYIDLVGLVLNQLGLCEFLGVLLMQQVHVRVSQQMSILVLNDVPRVAFQKLSFDL